MSGSDAKILDRPEAHPYRIQELMDKLTRGELRVPAFQRRLKWDVKDARVLFDSIYRGYPVGTLLFWRRPAPAARLRYGTVEVVAPASADAMWVVDGQQRLHALARVLLGAGAPLEEFALYFDLAAEQVCRPRSNPPPPHWLAMTDVLDEERLQEWIYARRDDLAPELRQRAFRLGRVVRQFEIPSYAVRTSDESAVREIFSRINNTGKRMDTHEVFDALHGALDAEHPSRMSEVAAMLADVGFGELDDKLLYKMLLALLGRDVGASDPPALDHDAAASAYQALERAARAAVAFMRQDAGIPHASLLPYELPLVALAKFFALHPDPSARTRDLLSRWVWRGALTGQHSGAIITMRRTLDAIDGDEHESVQRLLQQVPRSAPEPPDVHEFSFRTARGKLLTLVLLDLRPRHLETGELLDLHDAVYPDLLQTLFTSATELGGGVANRMIHPKLDHRLATTLSAVDDPGTLASHGVTREAQEALRRGDRADFLERRAEALKTASADLFLRRARWDEPDHMPVYALLVPEDA